MNRKQCLDAAAACVLTDRNRTYGEPEESLGKVAAGWSAILEMDITSSDVALMMAWLKIVRAGANPGHADNWVDMAGYAALGAELADGWSDDATRTLK
jgi:hypothetical protein